MVNVIPPTPTPVAAVKVQQSEAGVVEPQNEDYATHGDKCIYKPNGKAGEYSEWASTFTMAALTIECCDHYKIGILSGKKAYTPQDIRMFVDAVNALNPKSLYWKESLRKFVQKS